MKKTKTNKNWKC